MTWFEFYALYGAPLTVLLAAAVYVYVAAHHTWSPGYQADLRRTPGDSMDPVGKSGKKHPKE